MVFRHLHPAAARAAALFLIALVCGAAAGRAEVLTFANGDHLTGTIVKRADGKVYFHSEIVGDFVVPEEAVTISKSPAPATPVESLSGLPPASHPVAVTPPPPRWTGKVEFGYENNETNVRTVNTVLRADAEKVVGPDDYLAHGRYIRGVTSSVPNTDLEDASFRWRHNLSQRLFTQAQTNYTSDKIRKVHYEADQSAGIGYKLYQSLRQTVDVGAGVSAQYLNAEGIQRGFGYLGNAFQDFVYKINGRYTFTENASLDYAPASRTRFAIFGETAPVNGPAQDYAYKFFSTLQGKITDRTSLNLRFEYEFDNAVVDPAARATQRITTTLGYGF